MRSKGLSTGICGRGVDGGRATSDAALNAHASGHRQAQRSTAAAPLEHLARGRSQRRRCTGDALVITPAGVGQGRTAHSAGPAFCTGGPGSRRRASPVGPGQRVRGGNRRRAALQHQPRPGVHDSGLHLAHAAGAFPASLAVYSLEPRSRIGTGFVAQDLTHAASPMGEACTAGGLHHPPGL